MLDGVRSERSNSGSKMKYRVMARCKCDDIYILTLSYSDFIKLCYKRMRCNRCNEIMSVIDEKAIRRLAKNKNIFFP